MADFADPMHWMNLWNDLQKNSLGPWPGMMGKSSPAAGTAMEQTMAFWRENVNTWWRAFDPTPQPAPEQAFWHNLMAANAWFARLGEETYRTLQGGTPGQGWNEALRNLITGAQSQITNHLFPDPQAWRLLFDLPMDNLNRMMAASPFVPGDLFKAFKPLKTQLPGSLDPELKARLEQFLSTPAVGYTREIQEQHQRTGLYLLEYQEASQAFMDLMVQTLGHSMTLFHKQLLERAASDKPLRSLKEVYGLMVDCGEEAFGELAQSTTYTSANARVVNAMMQVKKQGQWLMEEGMAVLNMPSRTELDTSHQQVQALKRRLRTLENEIHELKTPDETRPS